MTSFSSTQDKPFEIKQYNVINETYTYRDLLPTETTTSQTVTLQPPKIYSFGDNLDDYNSLKQNTQTVTPLSTDLKPVSLEPTDITSRLDQLLKNAETALSRSKRREGSIPTYQPIATAPLTDIDSGFSLGSAEVQRRAAMSTIPNATIPQKYTSQPLDIGQSLSLSSAELYNKTPVTLTPNATSHRNFNLDFQNNEYNNLASAEAYKKTGSDSALKYSPIPYPSQTHDSEFISTKRSLLAGHENSQPLYKEEPQIPTTTTYETYTTTNYAKTLPRSYNLFPIQESERPSHVSQVEQNHEVQALKSGISNIEDLLRTLDHTGIGSAQYQTQYQPQPLSTTNFASQDLYSKPIPNVTPLDTYGDTTPNFSATYSIKARDFESATEQPKKSFAATTNFSTSANYLQINPNTYSKTPERGRNLSHEKSFEQEKTDQAMKNIDDLMQRHLFEKSPLRKSPITKNSTLRYMSPTRASGSPNPHLQNYETQRHWELINRSAEVSQPSAYIERERRASPDLYRRSSLQATPTPKDQQIYHQDFLQPVQTSYIQESQYVTKTPNTHSPMTKEVGLPQSYGSKTNYKEYYSPKTEKFLYRPSPGTSPYSPYTYDNYEKTNKSYVNNYGAGNEQYEGVADRYQDYGNPDVMNSADRKMKKLTLRAKSPEDSERKDGQRYTPSAKRDLQNAEGVFSEDDASQFDFHNSGHDDHHSYGKPSPKALPNTFKAGELIPDREDPMVREGVYNKFNSGELQHDANRFNSGELQHDPNVFNAEELQNDPQANQIQSSFKAGDLQADYESPYKPQNVHQPLKGDQGVEDFRSGELGDDQSPEKVPRNQRNIADDGKAWQMVHKVNAQMFDSPDHSFDFDSENAQYQQQMEEAAKMSKNRPRVQDPKPQQQRIVDPNLWVVDVPQAEAATNLSKSSQVLKQSVKKAQKKPIIAYCFEKFEKRNFSNSQ